MDTPNFKEIELDVDGIVCIQKNKIFRIERINSFKNIETGILNPIKLQLFLQRI